MANRNKSWIEDGASVLAGSGKLLFQHVTENQSMKSHYDNSIYDDYTSLNNTNISYNIHTDFFDAIPLFSMSTYAVILCILTIVVNLVVLIVCLRDKAMRQNGYYLQIVNLTIVNLVIATFVIPLTIYHAINTWLLGLAMCKVYIVADILLPFTSIVIMMLLNIDRQISVTHPRLHAWLFQGSLQWLSLFIPWFISFIIVFPIWTSGSIPTLNRPGECQMSFSLEAATMFPIITYFIPLMVLIVLNFRLLFVRLHSSNTTSIQTVSERIFLKPNTANVTVIEAEETNDVTSQEASPQNVAGTRNIRGGDDFTAVCLANLVYCVMWFPYQCTSFLLTICSNQSCIPTHEFTVVITWIGTSSACAVPLCWFIDSQLRVRLRALCGGKAVPKRMERSNSNETYL